jgi:hypothetical protein
MTGGLDNVLADSKVKLHDGLRCVLYDFSYNFIKIGAGLLLFVRFIIQLHQDRRLTAAFCSIYHTTPSRLAPDSSFLFDLSYNSIKIGA